MVDDGEAPETQQGVPDAQAQVMRPAQVLLGWLPEDRGLLVLNANRRDVEPTAAQRQRVEAARAHVANRPEGVDQVELLNDLPAELEEHVRQLRSGPAATMFADGWDVRLVDLARVCAFQPTVFVDSAAERTAGASLDDWAAVAEVTLPTQWRNQLPSQFDEVHQQWLLVSRNPNLRVIGHFSGPVAGPGSPIGFGFFVAVTPSFVNVALYQGRYFLHDGYHRALGLLARGIRRVPVFVKEYAAIHDLVPEGMLPQEAFVGPRPPTLPDFLDEQVAARVELPASQKMVIVHAMELRPIV